MCCGVEYTHCGVGYMRCGGEYICCGVENTLVVVLNYEMQKEYTLHYSIMDRRVPLVNIHNIKTEYIVL